MAVATVKQLKPLSDRVLVKAVEKEEERKGGIIIPDTAKEKPQEGEVIAVGPGKRDEQGKLTPMDVKVGDRILYGKYSGTEIKLDDEEYLIMHQDDILGIL
ncbi:MAG: co-chaperone GroES [Elusimicrobia bacterium]|nr:co-chaperone GroES [Elusimicrobiota bacterium]MBI3012319.1 co-chaperone GroES [Elusimicrobiota bacterium]